VLFDSKPYVFVVDDDAIIATTLVAILQRNGYKARCFTQPTEALAAARRESPDVLISDVNMPVLTGIELAILMRAQYHLLQVLLLSGNPASLELTERARSRGYDLQLLLKPIKPPDLLLHLGRMVVLHGQDICAQAAPLTADEPQTAMPLARGE
jgi:CheY-like chemotaxis protein